MVESQNDLLVMNVVVIPEQVNQMTVNLAAPMSSTPSTVSANRSILTRRLCRYGGRSMMPS